MNSLNSIVADLRGHLALCREILTLVENESHALHHSDAGPSFESYQAKKNLLPRLNQSLNQIRQHRATWQKLSPADREQNPEVPGLLRQNQDLIMKIIVLDRENEQALLRKGLVPPRQLPSANRQRPHFVADMYRRQGR